MHPGEPGTTNSKLAVAQKLNGILANYKDPSKDVFAQKYKNNPELATKYEILRITRINTINEVMAKK